MAWEVARFSIKTFSYLQGYHGLSKDDDRLWAMEIDREHSRGGGVLPHHGHAHLGWAGLDPPPVGALPLPSPHTTLAGESQYLGSRGQTFSTYCLQVTQTGARPRETPGPS